MERMSQTEKIIIFILVSIFGAFVGFIFWVLGFSFGESDMKLEALKHNVACFIADDKGKPKFAWKDECDKKR